MPHVVLALGICAAICMVGARLQMRSYRQLLKSKPKPHRYTFTNDFVWAEVAWRKREVRMNLLYLAGIAAGCAIASLLCAYL